MTEENKRTAFAVPALDLNPIFTGEKKRLSHTFEFMPDGLDADIFLASPIQACVDVFEKASAGGNGSESLVEAQITLSGSYTTSCARCLEELTLPIDMTSTYAVVTKLENDDGESEGCLVAPNGRLDVCEAADALFFMLLPSKHLCREDCLGLCPTCGKNKNVEKCNCSEKKIDPRLAVLQKYLDKSEK